MSVSLTRKIRGFGHAWRYTHIHAQTARDFGLAIQNTALLSVYIGISLYRHQFISVSVYIVLAISSND